jgi:hypothetical protein
MTVCVVHCLCMGMNTLLVPATQWMLTSHPTHTHGRLLPCPVLHSSVVDPHTMQLLNCCAIMGQYLTKGPYIDGLCSAGRCLPCLCRGSHVNTSLLLAATKSTHTLQMILLAAHKPPLVWHNCASQKHTAALVNAFLSAAEMPVPCRSRAGHAAPRTILEPMPHQST